MLRAPQGGSLTSPGEGYRLAFGLASAIALPAAVSALRVPPDVGLTLQRRVRRHWTRAHLPADR